MALRNCFINDWDDDWNEILRCTESDEERKREYYRIGDLGEEDKLFVCKYDNPVIKEILQKYHYKSSDITNPFDFTLYRRIPNYVGVKTIDNLVTTLINALVAYGSADEGFNSELVRRSDDIIKSFKIIDGTTQETYLGRGVDPEQMSDWDVRADPDFVEEDAFDGYDFVLKKGKYKATYRIGWSGW